MATALLALAAFLPPLAAAQRPVPTPPPPDSSHAGHEMPCMPDMPAMPGMAPCPDTGVMVMRMLTPEPLRVTMDSMGPGTTWVPDAAPLPSVYFAAPGRWDVTGHAFAFVRYDRQGGPRGGSQLGSLNWLMLMASHTLAGGRFQARTMPSLDAPTDAGRVYPLFLQTGEAYDGERLHDRQHPHDALMELSVLYERPVTRSLGVMLHAARSGEPPCRSDTSATSRASARARPGSA